MKEIQKVYSVIEFDAMMVLEFEDGMMEKMLELGKKIIKSIGGEIRLGYHLSLVNKKNRKMMLCINTFGKAGLVGKECYKYIDKNGLEGRVEIY